METDNKAAYKPCAACEGRRDKERRTGHVCDAIVPDLPTCPRCGKPLRDPPLPPGRYVLGCGAKVVVDQDGWVTEDAE